MGNRPIDPNDDYREADEVNLALTLMSLEDVAHFLGKPKGWVYGNWRAQGIPFKKVGAALRCRPRDLDQWLDRQGS
ncbi:MULTISPECIES: helix-turn-helix domain-containing protein [unclassified Streptomyces]|uniref:helix-turn-helix domain-containing protein n=1 Tax=unclassified Streptomyces TaxID=2593676 RepID=UPI00344F3769